MTKLLSRYRFPAILIFVIAWISLISAGLYSGLGVDEPPLIPLLARVAWIWAIGWWLTDDIRIRRERWLYCPGLLLASAWPLVVPYYLLKTRGPRALMTIASFAGICIAGMVIGVVLGVLLTTLLAATPALR